MKKKSGGKVMREQNWNEKMRALMENKKWDMKDWRRATKIDQRVLENLLAVDTTEYPKEELDAIYEATKQAKLDRTMLRFKEPIVIAVWAHKGGTGKSTTVANLSYELSIKGYNVLVIDTDSQSDVSSVLRPDYLEEPEINFYEAFSVHDDFEDDDYIRSTDYNGLDIVPGSEQCEALEATMSLMEERHRLKIWPKCLRRIREENYYDFILVDMDKTAGVMNKSIFEIADYVLSPIEPAFFSMKSLVAVLTQVEQARSTGHKLKLLGVFYNKVDMRKKKAFAETSQLVESIAGDMVLDTYIKSDANVENSQKEHLPLGYYNRNSVASKQMVELTEEILKRIQKDLEVK